MDKAEATALLQQCLAELLALPRSEEDSARFTRWRVRTCTALQALFGSETTLLRQFRAQTYWPNNEEADEIAHDQAWAAGKQAATQLLESALSASRSDSSG